jgi:hypothetical protein
MEWEWNSPNREEPLQAVDEEQPEEQEKPTPK